MNNKKRSILKPNLIVNFFKRGKITTTLTRAKLVQGSIEKIITKGKKVLEAREKNQIVALSMIRQIVKEMKTNDCLENVLKMASVFKEHKGGYLRRCKLGFFLDGSIKAELCPIITIK